MKSKNYPENIIKVFKNSGFVLSEPDVLLDSDYIIQRSGENFRKLMLTFEDDTGKSMCLRPDLTVASCIKYLKDNSKANSKIFYSGQAYRRSNNLKDKVVNEGDRIQLSSGYNGYVHRITPRVTYVRHGLNESLAIIPTKQIVTAEIVNFTKEIKLVPAVVDVGVSYLNDPKQVTSILVKVGKRAMNEVVDSRGRHLVRQNRCPYLEQYKASCGCDKDIHVDVTQPVVRFNKFNDSALDFSVWVYVRDYGSQFKTKSDMRLIMYEEFKKYDIRIPWPIRTVYQGDEKKEAQEIDQLNGERNGVMEQYGLGDLGKGEGSGEE